MTLKELLEQAKEDNDTEMINDCNAIIEKLLHEYKKAILTCGDVTLSKNGRYINGYVQSYGHRCYRTELQSSTGKHLAVLY